MSEQGEPTLSDAQRQQWSDAVRQWSAQFPSVAGYIVAVSDRLAWLEAERAHLDARADHATAELLALGRELRQTREERDEERHTYELLADHIEKLLPVRDDDVAEVALLMAAIGDVVKERDAARADAVLVGQSLSAALSGYSDLLEAAEPIDEAMSGRYTEEDERISKGCEVILDDSTLAARAAAVLATCVAEGEAFDEMVRATDKVQHRAAVVKEGAAQSARRRAVDAYRATLHDTT